ncbi:uncharacterized protein [Watersipora subatra]|uniref:uncharacterized protein n=1 Tax=Watersipora subatra TaxID=2589382 RepID=UPI00355B5C76
MTPANFDHLLSLIKPQISKADTVMRLAIEPELKLAVTLHHLAEGASHTSIAAHYRLGRLTTSQIIYDTVKALWNVLRPIYLKAPSSVEEWKMIAHGFDKWNFPHCIGSLDGKHITLQKPKNAGSTFFNYKQRESIILMAICDADYKFVIVDIGQPGSRSDGGVWDSMAFARGLESGNINIPAPEPIGGYGADMPYVLVADEAFPLRPYLMRPFPGRSLDTQEKRVFNYRLSRARRVIENAFGILSQRWRILFRMIAASQAKAVQIVQAVCVLHNYLRTMEDANYVPPGFADVPGEDGEICDGFWRTNVQDHVATRSRSSRSINSDAMAIRDFWCNISMVPEG